MHAPTSLVITLPSYMNPASTAYRRFHVLQTSMAMNCKYTWSMIHCTHTHTHTHTRTHTRTHTHTHMPCTHAPTHTHTHTHNRGYSSSFEWHGRHIDDTLRDSWGRRETQVVAIDALVFHSYEAQFEPGGEKRKGGGGVGGL